MPPQGTPAHGVPRPYFDGTPAHGMPRPNLDGTPAHGTPRPTPPQGTPAHGIPRPGFDGTPPYGTPAHGTPGVRGGHPEQREAGGGWGLVGGRNTSSVPAQATVTGRGAGFISAPRPGGPRQDYLDAFDDESVFNPPQRVPASSATGSSPDSTDPSTPAVEPEDEDVALDTRTKPAAKGPADEEHPPRRARKRGRGRAMAGIAAAAVTTVLAVVVVTEITGRQSDSHAQESPGGERDKQDDASRSDHRPTPADSKPQQDPKPLSYEEKMAKIFPLDADLNGSGEFDAVPGFEKAPGKGQLVRYRVDVEKGLGLDAGLFATAIQKTLNDDRSWAHNGGRTFERVSSGEAKFVITLASPGTTADWCAKSGLDTTQDNVSCDSAATDRVMINAFRWAQGAETFGDKLIYPYRQMLINHEVGHRLGFNHVTCSRDGALAPVMQQQTKFLSYQGITCKPNPWVYPNS
ncbi:DUF3152 domain-containing protein [Streptomyces sp. NA04227]|uniref:DUF3152 domain-containing protein n=1 Tax=Streptomyces sp. NA04227 TaxID=2742136 RepID=UPI0015921709|nr:DUF3152 domain-containing protein [Streptomyces sp. NA04227]QKW11127.1 DUF3152 domain-containing protein [Streptomyces sp. NA04227]